MLDVPEPVLRGINFSAVASEDLTNLRENNNRMPNNERRRVFEPTAVAAGKRRVVGATAGGKSVPAKTKQQEEQGERPATAAEARAARAAALAAGASVEAAEAAAAAVAAVIDQQRAKQETKGQVESPPAGAARGSSRGANDSQGREAGPPPRSALLMMQEAGVLGPRPKPSGTSKQPAASRARPVGDKGVGGGSGDPVEGSAEWVKLWGQSLADMAEGRPFGPNAQRKGKSVPAAEGGEDKIAIRAVTDSSSLVENPTGGGKAAAMALREERQQQRRRQQHNTNPINRRYPPLSSSLMAAEEEEDTGGTGSGILQDDASRVGEVRRKRREQHQDDDEEEEVAEEDEKKVVRSPKRRPRQQQRRDSGGGGGSDSSPEGRAERQPGNGMRGLHPAEQFEAQRVQASIDAHARHSKLMDEEAELLAGGGKGEVGLLTPSVSDAEYDAEDDQDGYSNGGSGGGGGSFDNRYGGGGQRNHHSQAVTAEAEAAKPRRSGKVQPGRRGGGGNGSESDHSGSPTTRNNNLHSGPPLLGQERGYASAASGAAVGVQQSATAGRAAAEEPPQQRYGAGANDGEARRRADAPSNKAKMMMRRKDGSGGVNPVLPVGGGRAARGFYGAGDGGGVARRGREGGGGGTKPLTKQQLAQQQRDQAQAAAAAKIYGGKAGMGNKKKRPPQQQQQQQQRGMKQRGPLYGGGGSGVQWPLQQQQDPAPASKQPDWRSWQAEVRSKQQQDGSDEDGNQRPAPGPTASTFEPQPNALSPHRSAQSGSSGHPSPEQVEVGMLAALHDVPKSRRAHLLRVLEGLEDTLLGQSLELPSSEVGFLARGAVWVEERLQQKQKQKQRGDEEEEGDEEERAEQAAAAVAAAAAAAAAADATKSEKQQRGGASSAQAQASSNTSAAPALESKVKQQSPFVDALGNPFTGGKPLATRKVVERLAVALRATVLAAAASSGEDAAASASPLLLQVRAQAAKGSSRKPLLLSQKRLKERLLKDLAAAAAPPPTTGQQQPPQGVKGKFRYSAQDALLVSTLLDPNGSSGYDGGLDYWALWCGWVLPAYQRRFEGAGVDEASEAAAASGGDGGIEKAPTTPRSDTKVDSGSGSSGGVGSGGVGSGKRKEKVKPRNANAVMADLRGTGGFGRGLLDGEDDEDDGGGGGGTTDAYNHKEGAEKPEVSPSSSRALELKVKAKLAEVAMRMDPDNATPRMTVPTAEDQPQPGSGSSSSGSSSGGAGAGAKKNIPMGLYEFQATVEEELGVALDMREEVGALVRQFSGRYSGQDHGPGRQHFVEWREFVEWFWSLAQKARAAARKEAAQAQFKRVASREGSSRSKRRPRDQGEASDQGGGGDLVGVEEQREYSAAVKVQGLVRQRGAQGRVATLRGERAFAVREERLAVERAAQHADFVAKEKAAAQARVESERWEKRRLEREAAAALVLQTARRKLDAKKFAHRFRQERSSAVKIQKRVRQSIAVKEVSALRFARREEVRREEEAAALKVQAAARRRSGQRRVAEMRESKKQGAAAVRIQGVARQRGARRRVLARRGEVERVKEEAEVEKERAKVKAEAEVERAREEAEAEEEDRRLEEQWKVEKAARAEEEAKIRADAEVMARKMEAELAALRAKVKGRDEEGAGKRKAVGFGEARGGGSAEGEARFAADDQAPPPERARPAALAVDDSARADLLAPKVPDSPGEFGSAHSSSSRGSSFASDMSSPRPPPRAPTPPRKRTPKEQPKGSPEPEGSGGCGGVHRISAGGGEYDADGWRVGSGEDDDSDEDGYEDEAYDDDEVGAENNAENDAEVDAFEKDQERAASGSALIIPGDLLFDDDGSDSVGASAVGGFENWTKESDHGNMHEKYNPLDWGWGSPVEGGGNIENKERGGEEKEGGTVDGKNGVGFGDSSRVVKASMVDAEGGGGTKGSGRQAAFKLPPPSQIIPLSGRASSVGSSIASSPPASAPPSEREDSSPPSSENTRRRRSSSRGSSSSKRGGYRTEVPPLGLGGGSKPPSPSNEEDYGDDDYGDDDDDDDYEKDDDDDDDDDEGHGSGAGVKHAETRPNGPDGEGNEVLREGADNPPPPRSEESGGGRLSESGSSSPSAASTASKADSNVSGYYDIPGPGGFGVDDLGSGGASGGTVGEVGGTAGTGGGSVLMGSRGQSSLSSSRALSPPSSPPLSPVASPVASPLASSSTSNHGDEEDYVDGGYD